MYLWLDDGAPADVVELASPTIPITPDCGGTVRVGIKIKPSGENSKKAVELWLSEEPKESVKSMRSCLTFLISFGTGVPDPPPSPPREQQQRTAAPSYQSPLSAKPLPAPSIRLEQAKLGASPVAVPMEVSHSPPSSPLGASLPPSPTVAVDYRDFFRQFDLNDDGNITKSELKKVRYGREVHLVSRSSLQHRSLLALRLSCCHLFPSFGPALLVSSPQIKSSIV